MKTVEYMRENLANNIDKSFLQMKMLNTKKGPAVRSLRAQADKITYKKEMLKTLENQENLDILEDMVKELLIKDNKIIGVLQSKDLFEDTFKECFHIVDSLPIPSRDSVKRNKYNSELIKETENYLTQKYR